MREIYDEICRDGFIAKEAYTDNYLGTIRKSAISEGHVSTQKKFWEGCLLNWYDRVVEIRIRPDEMPEVFFLTENSKKITGG